MPKKQHPYRRFHLKAKAKKPKIQPKPPTVSIFEERIKKLVKQNQKFKTNLLRFKYRWAERQIPAVQSKIRKLKGQKKTAIVSARIRQRDRLFDLVSLRVAIYRILKSRNEAL